MNVLWIICLCYRTLAMARLVFEAWNMREGWTRLLKPVVQRQRSDIDKYLLGQKREKKHDRQSQKKLRDLERNPCFSPSEFIQVVQQFRERLLNDSFQILYEEWLKLRILMSYFFEKMSFTHSYKCLLSVHFISCFFHSLFMNSSSLKLR